LDADVAVVRGVGRALPADAEGAARLEDTRRERGSEHTRSFFGRARAVLEGGLAGSVQLALEDRLGLAAELARRIVEREIGEALEARGGLGEAHLHVGVQARGAGTGEPL